MGGDHAPDAVIEGARRAWEKHGVEVILTGPAELLQETGLPFFAASEVVGMAEEPGQAIRRKKDSSLVRAAELVKANKAAAMVSAGNTGAAMAAALLRMGRLPGVARPAIATTLPVPGALPTVLLDAGANAECSASWLVQFAEMGSVFSRLHYGIERPRVGLLSIGEEAAKGTPLVKEAHALLSNVDNLNFIGNVEGRDLLSANVDVAVADGFTGNVALKALEGAVGFVSRSFIGAISADAEAKASLPSVMGALQPLLAELDPEAQGGAMLLGVDGLCVISHGSSSPWAIENALRMAHQLAEADMVGQMRAAVAAAS